MINESRIEKIIKMLLSPDSENNEVAFKLIKGADDPISL